MARCVDHVNLETPPLADPQQELLAALTKIIKEYPPLTPHNRREVHGLYSGPTSIALLFLRLWHSEPDLKVGGQSCEVWCHRYLASEPASDQVTPDR